MTEKLVPNSESTTKLVDPEREVEVITYRTRWAKALGVWQICLGLAAIGCNVSIHQQWRIQGHREWPSIPDLFWSGLINFKTFFSKTTKSRVGTAFLCVISVVSFFVGFRVK